MSSTFQLFANVSAGISEFKKNPMSVVEQGHGLPVVILNRNEPVFYAVPAEAFEILMEKLDDLKLVAMVKERAEEKSVKVSLDDL